MNRKSLIKLEKLPWDWGNSILYDMCKKNPTHKKPDIALAKIWLIGRSYSAAIERGAGEYIEEGMDFYVERVAPMLLDSKIDYWIRKLKKTGRTETGNREILLEAHSYLTSEIRKITGKDKRSLVSKYLHFHSPNSVFIFDSIATASIRQFAIIEESTLTYPKGYDNTYALFVERCMCLRDKTIEPKLGKRIAPRFLDKVLLNAKNGSLK